jgi:type I restriction enzyme R subunit
MMNENQLETLCPEAFRDIEWDVFHGPDIAPDGTSPN